ncbi:MAG: hypothetical protein B7X06_01615 [Verrucomicrobia bacterium 21-51-4]|nr:MAG: hypothetical protein B7X06_01615 [Verrucomicrobia bacterium 21-51-4]
MQWGLVITAKAARVHVYQSIFPRHIHPLKLNGHSLDTPTIYSAFVYLILIGFTLIAGASLTALFEPEMSFEGVFSATLSSIGNIGVSLNEVGPTQNWDFMTRKSKCLHAFIMLLGRLEFYALLALFVPKVWRRLG